jgi:hypothetical protein
MSVIAEARELAAEIVALDNQMGDARGREFAEECKLGLTLAHLIIEGFVTRVDSKALALLDNAMARGRQISNRPDAHQALTAETPAEGPIFPVGTQVVVASTQYPDLPVRCFVVEAEWDGEGYEYRFATEEGSFNIYEGDTRWDVQEYCPDEV